jgi:hypothetical protein
MINQLMANYKLQLKNCYFHVFTFINYSLVIVRSYGKHYNSNRALIFTLSAKIVT